ncbi:hypothetical protein AGMMS49942_20630 [Spirochaetia bacterium]|nr:hypothetical protein AGMMS49942_20630 [Spirochaetia bacterium]
MSSFHNSPTFYRHYESNDDVIIQFAEMVHGVEEMAKGAEQINIAVVQVNEISGENKSNIDTLNGEEVIKRLS